MSFDLAVWYEAAPITYEEADRKHALLCDGLDAGLVRHPAVDAFYADLVARFPLLETLSDDEWETLGVWSVSPSVDHGGLILCLSYRAIERVVPVMDELAERHGLVRFDPQAGWVLLPSTLTPPLTLEGDRLATVTGLTPPQIETVVRRLGTRHAYVVLESRPQYFVQAAHGATGGRDVPDGWYAVEYRDGSEDAHFRRQTNNLDEVVAAFHGFIDGDRTWKEHPDWRRWP